MNIAIAVPEDVSISISFTTCGVTNYVTVIRYKKQK